MNEIAIVKWKSPSNIAFIKYWGKHGDQLPMNPSLSMTLEKCYTETQISVKEKKEKKGLSFTFKFEGKENPAFSIRIGKYLNHISDRLNFLNDYHLDIESVNSFPHSAGIASSASAMSALALCLGTLEHRLGGNIKDDFNREVSELARLGSGSASRSIYNEFAIWGKVEAISNSSDNYAIPLENKIHPDFKCLRDAVLIVDSGEKKVSSSVGHSLMNDHPYAVTRFANANENLAELLKVMESGDFSKFAEILEHEALSLHAMMMTAKPWYSLLAPNSLLLMEKVREFRKETNTKITFTLDAGPNLHVIYPASQDKRVKTFIENEMLKYCFEQKVICDNIGKGPELIINEFNF